ncbi:MAG: tetratricopeptide repeat protein [Ignavibacteria bacterium]|nr:tetratricopeptide repeat protein [Ignavibacteria bacterium]
MISLRAFRKAFPILLVLSLSAVAQDTRENGEFKLAQGLYNDGLYAQAEDQFKVFIEKFPGTALGVEARFTLGLVQMKLKKWRDARASFQDFALRFPDNNKAPDAWWHLGEAFAAERNYPEAASAFARLKTFNPKNKRAPEALLEASRYFLKSGDTENAMLVLNTVLLEYPQSDAVKEATFALGTLFVAAGDYERAMREFTKVQNAGVPPGLKARATVAIGGIHALLGNAEEAERKYREVLTLYAKTDAVHEAWVRLGDLQRAQKKDADASASYETVRKNAAAPVALRVEATVGAAENALQAGRASDAARLYAGLFSSYPDQAFEAAVYRKASAASRKSGDYTASALYLEQLSADTLIIVDRRTLLVEMAENARAGRKPAQAIQYLRRYLDRYPSDEGAPFALLAIADIQEKDYGNLTRAAELYGEILNRYSASAVADQAQFARARVLEAQGKIADATEAYEQVLVQYPASSRVNDALLKLAELRRFKAVVTPEAFASLAAALSALQDKAGSGQVEILLGELYLLQVKDYVKAATAFASAIAKGVSGEDAQRAAFGRALAAARLAQKNGGGTAEAEQLLGAFVLQYPAGERTDEASYELYLLRTRDQSAVAVLDAASKYLAAKPGTRVAEVRIAFAQALLEAGRDKEAEQECSGVIDAARGTPEAGAAHFRRGIARVSLKNYNAAMDDFRECDRVAPNGRDNAQALFALGSTLLRTGQYGEAARVFESLADRFRYSPLADSASLGLLVALADGGRLPAAIARAQGFLRTIEENPFRSRDGRLREYLYQYAVLLARAKNVAAAKGALQRYATEFPDGARIGDVYFALGQIFKDEGRTSLATATLQKAAALNIGGQASLQVADLLLDDGKYDDAIREYERIAQKVQTKIERSYAQSRIVVALFRADRVADAQARAAEFRAAYPDAEPVFGEFEVERGRQLFRQKKYKEALSVFEDVADAKDAEAAALGLLWVARTHEAMNLDQEATEEFTELLKKYPRTSAATEASLSLARIAMRAERYDVAGPQFKNVAEAPKPSTAMLREALDGLITCYEELKMYDAAVEMTKRFLAAFPNDPKAFRKRVNLGVYYQQLQYFEPAITHLESLLSQATAEDQAEIRYYIGECYYYKGDFTQAALEFLKVPYLVVQKTEIDWTASSYYMAGQAYEKIGKPELALDLYQKIISTPGIDARYKGQAEKESERVKKLLNK